MFLILLKISLDYGRISGVLLSTTGHRVCPLITSGPPIQRRFHHMLGEHIAYRPLSKIFASLTRKRWFHQHPSNSCGSEAWCSSQLRRLGLGFCVLHQTTWILPRTGLFTENKYAVVIASGANQKVGFGDNQK